MAMAGLTRGGEKASTQALRLLALENAGDADLRKRQSMNAAAILLSVLFERFLFQDNQAGNWPDRDRLVMAPTLRPLACALVRLLGWDSPGGEQDKARGNGEPKTAETAADPATAGNGTGTVQPRPGDLDLAFDWPGHSLAAGIGLALAARMLRERFGPEIFDHATCIIVDDSEVEPGVAQETIAIAPHVRPHRLFVFHLTPEDAQGNHVGRRHCPNHLARFAAAGWHVQQARADDVQSIIEAVEQGADQGVATWEERRPVYVAVHYRADAPVPEAQTLRGELGWDDLNKAEVPDFVRDAWRLAGLRARKAHKEWRNRLEQLDTADHTALIRQLERPFPERFRTHMREWRQQIASEGGVLDMGGFLPRMLAESLQTLSGLAILSALPDSFCPDFRIRPEGDAADGEADGSSISANLGLRPAAVAALLTGMSAHGGLRPVGLVRRQQLEPMLPMLAEAARVRLPLAVLVLDDLPCHTPLHGILPERIAGYTPADAVELVECWQLCMQQEPGPAVILTPVGSRPVLRTWPEKLNLCALGAYELFSSGDPAQATIHAGGVHLAASLKAARELDAEGLPVQLVSTPAPHRLRQQDAEHHRRIVGAGRRRVVVSGIGERCIWPFLATDISLINPCEGDVPLDEDALASRIVRRVRKMLASRAGTTDGMARDVGGEAHDDGSGNDEGERPG